MHLDRKITLYQPGAMTRDSEGIATRADPTSREVYARRIARAGNESIALETQLQTHPVEYIIRQSTAVSNINKDWWLSDDGQEYRIESVHEPAIGRRQFFVIRAVART